MLLGLKTNVWQATGGNDNLVSIWDARSLAAPKFQKTNHRAAVKALSWCPWQPNLLASGGGSYDRVSALPLQPLISSVPNAFCATMAKKRPRPESFSDRWEYLCNSNADYIHSTSISGTRLLGQELAVSTRAPKLRL